ncbi:hypothetical protein KOW79_017443 [Hemibagrus wyckioides]|uniref:Uncharacterized protein n=1 Tax=Hemibagrus wyckioides TaxID=337641 RepID=A0A9D3NAN6_9TELE|nr:hypothetical protein KOW79_017443 [Hemibagrus wyckioides]
MRVGLVGTQLPNPCNQAHCFDVQLEKCYEQHDHTTLLSALFPPLLAAMSIARNSMLIESEEKTRIQSYLNVAPWYKVRYDGYELVC